MTLVVVQELLKVRSHSESTFELFVPSFSVQPGKFIAVIGESGCGKSTLLDLLALVSAPSQVRRFEMGFAPHQVVDVGRLWQEGREGELAAVRRTWFGYVLQTGGLLPFLSVRQNVLLPAQAAGRRVDVARLQDLAGRLGVAHCLERKPESLSIGQRQRVAILRALIHQPRLVLADEPTAAVDKARAAAIMDDLFQLAREEGVAVVVVTHDVHLVFQRADAVYSFTVSMISPKTARSVCTLQEGA